MNKNGEWNAIRRTFTIIVDAPVLNVSIYPSFLLKFQGEVPTRDLETFQHSVIFISIIFIALNILLGAYTFYNRMISDIAFITVIGQVLIALGIMVVIFIGRWFAFPRGAIVLSFTLGTILLSVYRIVAYKLYLRVSCDEKILTVSLEKDIVSAVQNFQSKKSNKHEVEAVVIDNYYENTRKLIDDIGTVYLASKIPGDEKINIYWLVIKREKKLFLNTTFESLTMTNSSIMNFEDGNIIEASGSKIQLEYKLFKRLFDVIVSFILLILVSPSMLIIAILIKAISPGPIIYKQVRTTKNQKGFSIYKFRSISAAAEAKSGPVLAKSNDVRMTPVGEFIRAVRFDELPRIFSVSKGDISIVGPRPERPFFVDRFSEGNPYYYSRHNVRARVTGYTQVCGKCVLDYSSRLRLDLLCIKKYSSLLDLEILFQAIKVLFGEISLQGLDEDENISSLIKIDLSQERIHR